MSKRVSGGLESGLIHKKFPGAWSFETYSANVDILQKLRFDDSFDMIPVVLNGYYFFHRGRMDIYLKGGLGVYFGRYALNETSSGSALVRSDFYQDGTYVDSRIDSAQYACEGQGAFHGASLGLHAGVGVEWKIAAKVRLGPGPLRSCVRRSGAGRPRGNTRWPCN